MRTLRGPTLAQKQAFWRSVKTIDLDGFQSFCRKLLRIRVLTDGEWRWVPLHLTSEQTSIAKRVFDDLAAGKPVRLVILKSRRVGTSTLCQALAYFFGSLKSGWKTLVVAHQQSSTVEIATIGTGMAAELPPFAKPRVGAKEVAGGLAWSNGSRMRVMTQRSDHASRGASPSYLHLSELGLWDFGRANSSASATFTALIGSIKYVPGTIIIGESTACGDSGLWAELWEQAWSGKDDPTSVWTPVFIPWQETDTFSWPLTPEEQTVHDEFCTLLDNGDELQAQALVERTYSYPPVWSTRACQYRLTPPQVRFAIAKVQELGGDIGRFDQEFPLSPLLAFQASGRPVFAGDTMPAQGKEPLLKSGLLIPDKGDIRASCTPGDEWQVWQLPQAGWQHRYAVSADVSAGSGGGDYSCIQVYDRHTSAYVAEYYSRKCPPDVLAAQLRVIGTLYGTAWVIPESNNHGHVVIRELLDSPKYPRLWQSSQISKSASPHDVSWVGHWGWQTTSATRTPALDAFAAAVRLQEVTVNSSRLLKEMRSLEYDKKGRASARANAHDDAVMAAAIALAVDSMLPDVVPPVPTTPVVRERERPQRTHNRWGR